MIGGRVIAKRVRQALHVGDTAAIGLALNLQVGLALIVAHETRQCMQERESGREGLNAYVAVRFVRARASNGALT